MMLQKFLSKKIDVCNNSCYRNKIKKKMLKLLALFLVTIATVNAIGYKYDQQNELDPQLKNIIFKYIHSPGIVLEKEEYINNTFFKMSLDNRSQSVYANIGYDIQLDDLSKIYDVFIETYNFTKNTTDIAIKMGHSKKDFGWTLIESIRTFKYSKMYYNVIFIRKINGTIDTGFGTIVAKYPLYDTVFAIRKNNKLLPNIIKHGSYIRDNHIISASMDQLKLSVFMMLSRQSVFYKQAVNEVTLRCCGICSSTKCTTCVADNTPDAITCAVDSLKIAPECIECDQ